MISIYQKTTISKTFIKYQTLTSKLKQEKQDNKI